MTSRPSTDFERDLLAVIPFLRAFAFGICRNPHEADDLAQETVAKAWRNHAQFTPGTNIKGWTCQILKNHFYTGKRRAWQETPLEQEWAERLPVMDNHALDALALDDLRQALTNLPLPQREALILVGAGGLSYEEAAKIAGVAEGTIKSRVSRARISLLRILDSGDFRRDGAQTDHALETIMAETKHRGGGL